MTRTHYGRHLQQFNYRTEAARFKWRPPADSEALELMEKMRAFTKNDRALDANANTEETEDRTRTIIDYEVIDGPKRRRRLKKQINTKRAGGSY